VIFKKVIVCAHIDGDTTVVKLDSGLKERVRFIGINCPESTIKQELYGKEASYYTKNSLLGKVIYLEKDISDRDIYGRLLRYVWLQIPSSISGDEIRNKMFNAILLTNGYAKQATYNPDIKYSGYFGKYVKEAKMEKKGIWGIE
jgi:micrococcal nuclease